MGYEYYDYGYNAGNAIATGLGAMLGVLIFVWVIGLAVMVFSIICMWKVFKKAGRNGWEAIVPIYNIIVLLEITKLPMWYIILFFIPIGNIVVIFLIYIELAKKFGQSTAFGIGLVFLNPIFMAILAFGKKYVYQGQETMNYTQQINNYNQPINNVQPTVQNVQPTSVVEPVQPIVEPTMSIPVVEPVQSEPFNSVPHTLIDPIDQPIVETTPIVEQTQPVEGVGVPVVEQSVQKSNCSNCGSSVNPGDRFCMNCGTQL